MKSITTVQSFCWLYHKVTCKVKECINEKNFEDRKRKTGCSICHELYHRVLFMALTQTNIAFPKTAFEAFSDNSKFVIQHLSPGDECAYLHYTFTAIRKKEGPCRNRGRLPKLTAYEKIEI